MAGYAPSLSLSVSVGRRASADPLTFDFPPPVMPDPQPSPSISGPLSTPPLVSDPLVPSTLARPRSQTRHPHTCMLPPPLRLLARLSSCTKPPSVRWLASRLLGDRKGNLHELTLASPRLADRTTPHTLRRWGGTAVLLVLFFIRIVWAQAYYIVCYALGYVRLRPTDPPPFPHPSCAAALALRRAASLLG